MKRYRLSFLLLPLLILAGTASAVAQYGQFEGVVRDTTGAVLPGATVVVTDPETGVSRTAVSAGDGYYRIPGVTPGVYNIQCSLSGFTATTFTDIILTIQQTVIQNFELSPAQIEETVTVTGESPIVVEQLGTE